MREWDILQTMRDDIQAEHTLLSHRMAWYAAAQSFLVTAYAIAWGNDHAVSWKVFFQDGVPILGILLSICAWLGIFAAVRVQSNVIKDEADFIRKIERRLDDAKDTEGRQKLEVYRRITCSGRDNGVRYHWMSMVPQCLVPIIFLFMWVAAWLVSVLSK